MDEQTQARDVAREAIDEAKQQALRAKDQVEHGAREAVRMAADKADAAAGTLVQESRALASALRGAADHAERDGARLVQGALRGAAGALERWVDQAGRGDSRHLLTKLEELGRRQPLVLFGAASAMGFIGTRVLRAGAQARSTATPHRDEGGREEARREEPEQSNDAPQSAVQEEVP